MERHYGGRRRRVPVSVAAMVMVIAVAAGLATLATADPPLGSLGVRSTALYVGSDGGDSRAGTGPDFTTTATGVNAGDGNLVVHEIDDPIANADPSLGTAVFSLDRWYNSRSTASRDIGRGWTTGLGYDVRLESPSSTEAIVWAPSQHAIAFTVDSGSGPFTSPADLDYTLSREAGGGWRAHHAPSGRSYVFDAGGKLQRIEDANSGSSERFDYTSAGGQDRLSAVYGPKETATRFSFNGSGQIIEADNPSSAHGYYAYTGDRLHRATHPDGAQSDYGYDAAGRLTSIARPGYALSVAYDDQARVTSLSETVGGASSVTVTLTYRAPQPGTCDPDRDASQTDVSSTSGTSGSYCFDASGNLTAGAAADLPEQTIAIGNRAWALGDADGDAATDLVLVDRVTGAVSVRPGQSDGSFAAESPRGTFGAATQDIVADDVDGFESDDVDAASGTADIVARAPTAALDLRLSDGDQVGAPPSGAGPHQGTWPVGRTLGLADVDGDGSADLWAVDPSDNEVKVALGGATGFAPSTTRGTVPAGVTTLLADVDGNDGRSDLITYDPSSGAIRVGPAGTSGFAPLATRGTGPTGADVAAGDLNGQGSGDLYFRVPDGTVTARRTSMAGSISSAPIALGKLPADYALSAFDMTAAGPLSVVGTKVVGTDLKIRVIDVAAIMGTDS